MYTQEMQILLGKYYQALKKPENDKQSVKDRTKYLDSIFKQILKESSQSIVLDHAHMLLTDVKGSSMLTQIYHQEYLRKYPNRIPALLDHNGIPINPELSIKMLVFMGQSAFMKTKISHGFHSDLSRYTGDGFDLICGSKSEFISAINPILIIKILFEELFPKLYSKKTGYEFSDFFVTKKLGYRIFLTEIKDLTIRYNENNNYPIFEGKDYSRANKALKDLSLEQEADIRIVLSKQSLSQRIARQEASKIFEMSSDPSKSLCQQISDIVFNFRNTVEGAKINYQARKINPETVILPFLYDEKDMLLINEELKSITKDPFLKDNFIDTIDTLPISDNLPNKLIESGHVAAIHALNKKDMDIFIDKVQGLVEKGLNISTSTFSPLIIMDLQSLEVTQSTTFMLGWPTYGLNLLHNNSVESLSKGFLFGCKLLYNFVVSIENDKTKYVDTFIKVLVTNPDRTAASRPYKSFKPGCLLSDNEIKAFLNKVKTTVSHTRTFNKLHLVPTSLVTALIVAVSGSFYFGQTSRVNRRNDVDYLNNYDTEINKLIQESNVLGVRDERLEELPDYLDNKVNSGFSSLSKINPKSVTRKETDYVYLKIPLSYDQEYIDSLVKSVKNYNKFSSSFISGLKQRLLQVSLSDYPELDSSYQKLVSYINKFVNKFSENFSENMDLYNSLVDYILRYVANGQEIELKNLSKYFDIPLEVDTQELIQEFNDFAYIVSFFDHSTNS